LHPEQDAQQSVEEQHDEFATFAVPARPNATTAINTIALIFLMDFSPLKNQIGCCQDGDAIDFKSKQNSWW